MKFRWHSPYVMHLHIFLQMIWPNQWQVLNPSPLLIRSSLSRENGDRLPCSIVHTSQIGTSPSFILKKQWNLNCSTIGPRLEIQIGRRKRVQTNRKNNKLPVATRFLGSFDGNGGVYYALFKKPAGDSEKRNLFTEPKHIVNLKPFDDKPGKTGVPGPTNTLT